MDFWRRSRATMARKTTIESDISDLQLPNSGQIVMLRSRINPRAKRLTMRYCTKSDQLQLTRPAWITEKELLTFIASHESWILSQINKAPEKQPFFDGALIPYRDRPTLIRHEPGRGRPVTYDPDANHFSVRGDIAHLPRRLTTWLKADIKEKLTEITQHNCKALGVHFGKITIRDQSSRWGSCAANGNLNYNWRITFAPDAVIHYLCAHECAHLIEMNHGPKFWQITEDLCQLHESRHPAKTSRAWLRQNGARLFRVGS